MSSGEVDHLVDGEHVVAADVEVLPERARLVQKCDELVGEVVHRDSPEPLVATGQQDRGSAPGTGLDSPEPCAAVPDDHARTQDRHVQAAAEQQVLDGSTAPRPGASGVVRHADRGHVEQPAHPVRLAGGHDAPRSRTMHRTRCPPAPSAATTRCPTNPVPPITRTARSSSSYALPSPVMTWCAVDDGRG